MRAIAFHSPDKLSRMAEPLPDAAPSVSETPLSTEAFLALVERET